MVYKGKDGHPGPALSIADIVTTLYFDEMRVDPKNPEWEDRDRFILSKGHACPIWYAALSEKGFFGEKVEDFKLRALGSKFQGHPTMQKTKGVDMTSGSLGNGIAIGAGMALGGKHMKKDFNVFVIVGDGELQEGICWEGINTAAAHKLDNLIVFADRHDIDAIKTAIANAKAAKGKPSVIVCDCVKGKGLSFMENDNAWHKGVPTDEQYEIAKKELLGGAQ